MVDARAGNPVAGPAPFYRLFPELAAWSPPGASAEERAAALAHLAASMIVDGDGEDNPGIPAGYTYLGQFIDHDLTFMTPARGSSSTDPAAQINLRTPALDLDSLYSGGPGAAPYLYDRERPFRFLLGKGRQIKAANVGFSFADVPATKEDDLPRNDQGVALIGDRRNDENVLVSQVGLVFLKFHNAVLDWVESQERRSGTAAFERAQQLVRRHYQWVVLHDFLPRLVGEDLVDELICRSCGAGTAADRWQNSTASLPLEFTGAAFRMGHSMVRSGYHLNSKLRQDRQGLPLPIFQPPSPLPDPVGDLGGGRPLPEFWTVQWDLFLEGGRAQPQLSRRLDASLNANLARVPDGRGETASLAHLNLLRGWKLGLPSGQAVARALKKRAVLDNGDLGLPAGFGEAPLWYYILREAHLEQEGKRLGAVGRQIVARTLVKLLHDDPDSFLNAAPHWRPCLGSREIFELYDLIAFAKALAPPFIQEGNQP